MILKNIPKIQFQTKRPFPSEGFELLDLEILRTQTQAPVDHDPHQHHRLNFFALLMLSDGEARHNVDFESIHIKKGDCLIVAKGQIHAFDPQGRYIGYLLLFTEEFLAQNVTPGALRMIAQLFSSYLGKQVFHTPELNNKLLESLQPELQTTSGASTNSILGALLTLFLLKLRDQQQQGLPESLDQRSYDHFIQFETLLESNYTSLRDARDYAKSMQISYKHLNTICKTVAKQTAKALIDNFVILEAKRRLIATTLSVKEISYQLGFDEPSNFLKYFKKHTQLTPIQFRKKVVRHLPF